MPPDCLAPMRVLVELAQQKKRLSEKFSTVLFSSTEPEGESPVRVSFLINATRHTRYLRVRL